MQPMIELVFLSLGFIFHMYMYMYINKASYIHMYTDL